LWVILNGYRHLYILCVNSHIAMSVPSCKMAKGNYYKYIKLSDIYKYIFIFIIVNKTFYCQYVNYVLSYRLSLNNINA